MTKTTKMEMTGILEYWVIYHPQLGKEKLTKPENYFAARSAIGPAFGAAFEVTPRFASAIGAGDVLMSFPVMVLARVQHVGLVPPELKTFKWKGRNAVAQLDIDATVAAIRKMPNGDYLMGGPEGPRSPEDEATIKRFYDHIAKYTKPVWLDPFPVFKTTPGSFRKGPIHEAEEKEDGKRTAVRELEPGQGVELNARGQEPQEVEAPGEPIGAEERRDDAEGRPAAETKEAGEDDGRVIADSILAAEDARFLAETDRLIEQSSMGMGCFARPLAPSVALMTKEDFNDIASPQTIEDVRFYVEDTRVRGGDREIHEPEHTQDPDSEWPYAGGDVVCDQCGKRYGAHPLDGPEGYDGKFLNRICDGRLVKL